MKWTQKDQRLVREVIAHCAAKCRGGQAELARELGLSGRSTINAWATRGKIPIQYHPAIIRRAHPEMVVTGAQLHPNARLVVKQISRGVA